MKSLAEVPMLSLRMLAWLPPLPPTLAGPLLGALLSRWASVDLIGAAELGAALVLAVAWVTAPMLLALVPCNDPRPCAIVVR